MLGTKSSSLIVELMSVSLTALIMLILIMSSDVDRKLDSRSETQRPWLLSCTNHEKLNSVKNKWIDIQEVDC